MKVIFLGIMFIINGLISFGIAQTNDLLNGVTLLSVYELSPKITAVVSNMSDDDVTITAFDEIFIKVDEQEKFREEFFNFIYDDKMPVNATTYDTAGIYRLIYNKMLDKELRDIVDKEFYIYGTQGVEIGSVKDIVFALDECKTNIYAFTIEHFNKENSGHPVLASNKKLDLIYGSDYQVVENMINEFYSELESDYKDDVKVKVFANMGSLYFTYSDNFKWNKNTDQDNNECFFPARGIFSLSNDKKIIPVWEDELDLYGIPCD